MNIIVVSHNLEWAQKYEDEAAAIKRILADNLLAIHHIGSTAVTGLAAKPIIDIMPVVQNIAKVDICNSAFTGLGYECMGEFGICGRRYFRKGGDSRTFHVHVFQSTNTKDIGRHLALRDYLRTHPKAAKEYGELKQNLATRYPNDIDGYCNDKDAFVKRLEKEALAWVKTVSEV